MISRMSSINNTNGETITSYVFVDLGARRLLDFPRFVCLLIYPMLLLLLFSLCRTFLSIPW